MSIHDLLKNLTAETLHKPLSTMTTVNEFLAIFNTISLSNGNLFLSPLLFRSDRRPCLPMFYFFTSMPYTLLCIYTSVLWITLDQKLKRRGMLYRKTQNRTEETYFLIDGQQFTCVI